MDVPTHRERQFMQHLRAGGWVTAGVAPAGAKLIENLLAKGWIENAVSSRATSHTGLPTKASRPRRCPFGFTVERRLA
jgi:hypothetical protein